MHIVIFQIKTKKYNDLICVYYYVYTIENKYNDLYFQILFYGLKEKVLWLLSTDFPRILIFYRTKNKYVSREWADVCVGDMLHLSCDEVIPADILLLRSSDRSKICFIETSNLDGESNLKQRDVVNKGYRESVRCKKCRIYDDFLKNFNICEELVSAKLTVTVKTLWGVNFSIADSRMIPKIFFFQNSTEVAISASGPLQFNKYEWEAKKSNTMEWIV